MFGINSIVTNRFLTPSKNIFNSPVSQIVRNATKKAGGSTKNGRDSNAKSLGVKKFGGEFVNAGNILIRQRGKSVYPGENVGLGKDYTVFALTEGYVYFSYSKIVDKYVISVFPENRHQLEGKDGKKYKEMIEAQKSAEANAV